MSSLDSLLGALPRAGRRPTHRSSTRPARAAASTSSSWPSRRSARSTTTPAPGCRSTSPTTAAAARVRRVDRRRAVGHGRREGLPPRGAEAAAALGPAASPSSSPSTRSWPRRRGWNGTRKDADPGDDRAPAGAVADGRRGDVRRAGRRPARLAARAAAAADDERASTSASTRATARPSRWSAWPSGDGDRRRPVAAAATSTARPTEARRGRRGVRRDRHRSRPGRASIAATSAPPPSGWPASTGPTTAAYWEQVARYGSGRPCRTRSILNDGYAAIRCGEPSGVGVAVAAGTAAAIAARGADGAAVGHELVGPALRWARSGWSTRRSARSSSPNSASLRRRRSPRRCWLLRHATTSPSSTNGSPDATTGRPTRERARRRPHRSPRRRAEGDEVARRDRRRAGPPARALRRSRGAQGRALDRTGRSGRADRIGAERTGLARRRAHCTATRQRCCPARTCTAPPCRRPPAPPSTRSPRAGVTRRPPTPLERLGASAPPPDFLAT